MPASIIVPALFTAGTFSAAAATFAIHVATTIAVNSLISRDAAEQSTSANLGGRVQLPPTTDNKLPVVYGNAWVTPIITDVKISADQQTMWYVLAFSETTDSGDIKFGEVYFDDKLLLFRPDNPSEIRGWFNPNDNTTVTGPAGNISMWFYKNGSLEPTSHYCIDSSGNSSFQTSTQTAIQVLQDSGLINDAKWKNTDLMTNTVFAVMRIKYDQDHGITGLGQIKARIMNTLTQPGSVMKDYLINDRYGCGIPQESIDLESLNKLDEFCGEQITINNTSGGVDSGTRATINGIIDTTRDCLTNLITIADSADSWVQWNETKGMWGALVNSSLEESGKTVSDIRVITNDNIIGGIQINPLDLNSTYNSVSVQFPNSFILDDQGNPMLDTYRGQSDYRRYELEENQRFANEPNNQLTMNLPLVNNSLQATLLSYRRLWASREDLIINFTMDYSGIQIDAGEIIAIKHSWYSWGEKAYGDLVFPGKPFRVTQVRELKSSDGTLSAQITATSYNNEIYSTTNPHYWTRSSFSGVTDPSYISKPNAPTFPSTLVSTGTSYVVQGEIPLQGNVDSMEFWYSVKGADLTNNNYSLYRVQNYTKASLYPHYANDGNLFYEQIQLNNLAAGTYYWRTRARGPNSASEFSEPSIPIEWAGSNAIDGANILDNTISGSKVISGDPAKIGTSQSKGFFDTLGPWATAGLGAATLYAGYKKGWFDDIVPKVEGIFGAGNDEGTIELEPTIWSDRQNPNEGDEVWYTADATPDPGPVADNANFWDFELPSVSSWFSNDTGDSGDSESWFDW